MQEDRQEPAAHAAEAATSAATKPGAEHHEKGYARVRILLFGKAREVAETTGRELVVPSKIKAGELRRLIFEEHFPQLAEIQESCVLAVNQRYQTDPEEELELTDNCEVAVIPPLSGG
ncbi:ThiS family protein [Aphelenchoides avenae]|nr:ThiS family protein [Aphelenchus avenae]